MAWKMTYQKYQTPDNLVYPKFRPKRTHLGPQNFRAQIISPTPNCRTQIRALAPRSKSQGVRPPGAEHCVLSVR